MSDSVVLSLGHNSSAILIRDGKLLAGYETERMTGVKSDSSFPEKPITELHRRFRLKGAVDFYVSHWELSGECSRMKNKHWDAKFVRDVGGGRIFQSNEYFTHHDAHAWSAVLFAGKDFPQKPEDKSYLFVMDGFGTFGEHMSFYRLVDGIPILLERKFGFGSSLGLLYQYATSFMGMKMNQDEYKLLAFESKVELLTTGEIVKLNALVDRWADLYRRQVSGYMTVDRTDPMLDVGALPNTAKRVADMLSEVCIAMGVESEFDRRVVCSYFVQGVVEDVVMMFVSQYLPQNIVLAGGLFYNVKLNNLISKMVPGKTCIMPLAGDQGAGLGVYKSINPDFELPGHLFWGQRDLENLQGYDDEGIVYFTSKEKGFELVADCLRKEGLVNLVRGSMEFGPRALCHTTTLALPDPGIAARINRVNHRVNEMPFAPVMTSSQAELLLIECEKIHKSLEYMVCTRDYRDGREIGMMGAAHKYPLGSVYSARPQVTADPMVVSLLHEFGPLINTSFNYHGVPIVCTAEQIRHSHSMERTISQGDWPVTVVIDSEED